MGIRLLRWFACALALPLAMQTLAADKAPKEPLQIGFLYQSPISDVGWVAQHELARKQLEKEFGNRIRTHYVENVKVGADGGRVMRDMVGQGDKLLILGSFGFMTEGLKLAADEPDVKFMHASGYRTAPNFSTYDARWYEGAYVAGVLAAKVTKSKTLGYVGAVPIPVVVALVNAFTQGARSVDPSISVKVVWVNEWYDPGREREAAQALIDQGADVIGSAFQDTPAVVQLAESKGVWSIGMFSDVTRFAPNRLITSITHDWTPFMRKAVQETLAGNFKGQSYLGGLKDKVVALTPFNKNLPADAVALANKAEQDIIDGRLLPFAGPLKDADGKERVAKGASLPEKDILSMNWLVEGIVGKLPN